jgi:hypothetical protein
MINPSAIDSYFRIIPKRLARSLPQEIQDAHDDRRLTHTHVMTATPDQFILDLRKLATRSLQRLSGGVDHLVSTESRRGEYPCNKTSTGAFFGPAATTCVIPNRFGTSSLRTRPASASAPHHRLRGTSFRLKEC